MSTLSPMEAAKIGRQAQLTTLREFLAGQEVTFRNHQGKGFTCLYDPAALERRRAPTKLKFDDVAVFLEAAAKSDAAEVDAWLAKGMDPNATSQDGLTALHLAAIENNIEIATRLLDKGAGINTKDNDGWTPLHAAAACGNWRMATFLLSQGADLLASNADGELPVDLVDDDQKTTAALEAEARARGIDDAALDAARARGHTDLVAHINELVAARKPLNSRDRRGATALHAAACNGWLDVMELLLKNGADPNVRDSEGNTPLHAAVFFLQYKAAEMLGKNGADVTLMNRYHEAPLALTDDAIMCRMLKAMLAHKPASAAPAAPATPHERVYSSMRRKTMLEKHDAARLDQRSEASTLESNLFDVNHHHSPTTAHKTPTHLQGNAEYAVVDFGNKTKNRGKTPQEIEAERKAAKEVVPATPPSPSPSQHGRVGYDVPDEMKQQAGHGYSNNTVEEVQYAAGPVAYKPGAGAQAAAAPAAAPAAPAATKKKKKKGGCTVQ